jgi:hypothetical protein
MGKKRITQLLDQLKENQQQDLQNSAAIFTVAQVAVNQLQDQLASPPQLSAAVPRPLPSAAESALPAAPLMIDEAELRRRYGSHTACRQAAKAQGIKFSKTPSWHQLSIAFSYLQACQQIVQSYLQTYPNDQLKGISIQLNLD